MRAAGRKRSNCDSRGTTRDLDRIRVLLREPLAVFLNDEDTNEVMVDVESCASQSGGAAGRRPFTNQLILIITLPQIEGCS